MSDPRSVTGAVETAAEPDAILDVLADPRQAPRWAPDFADTIEGSFEDGWEATKGGVSFAIRVAVAREAGTVDYLRRIAPGREAGAFLRVMPRPGGGSVVVMTLPVMPGADAAEVAATLAVELEGIVALAGHDLRQG
jgi:hypothetical protein